MNLQIHRCFGGIDWTESGSAHVLVPQFALAHELRCIESTISRIPFAFRLFGRNIISLRHIAASRFLNLRPADGPRHSEASAGTIRRAPVYINE